MPPLGCSSSGPTTRQRDDAERAASGSPRDVENEILGQDVRMVAWLIDKDIESSVQSCTECQATQSVPPSAPLHLWSWPTRRWSRLHVDYAGPFQGHMFLVVIDAHSKWIEAWPVHAATSSATIEKLRTSFAQFGLPETIVSDNGTCFVSEEFESFLQANGIKHVTSAPYHPSSNGLAERAV